MPWDDRREPHPGRWAGSGEKAATLNDDESIAVIRILVEAAEGRVVITAGVGSSSPAHSIDLASRSAEIGARALLLVMPHYRKPIQPVSPRTPARQPTRPTCLTTSRGGRAISPESGRSTRLIPLPDAL
ncbi:dihydrodipicolinate synthase family protein [Micromonospora sp. NPDC048986]|uniref:dihydrodipicolinate synthase family protein n=1 Tax=Micromonospora sp. NPDC048986 TaxID=3155644 RepID=UPI0033CCFF18